MAPDELTEGWLEAWSGRDPGAFAAVCDPAVSYEDPITAEPLEGPAALGEHVGRLWAGLPDARLQATGATLTDGRYRAVPCRLLGSHTQPLGGLPPTQRFLVVHCVFYCETTNQRMLRVRAFFDLYDAGVQLGVLPGRGTLGEKALLMVRGFGLRAQQ